MALALIIHTGADAEELAPLFWQSLPKPVRRHTLWDVPWKCRGQRLAEIWKGSALVGLCLDEGAPAAAAWISPLGLASGAVHFSLNIKDAKRRKAIGQAFLKLAAARFQSLLCLIPAPFRGARAYAESLGFQPLARLPLACEISLHRRHVEGVLYSYQERQ